MSSAVAKIMQAKRAAQLTLEVVQRHTATDGPRAILTGQVVSLNAASHEDGAWVMGYLVSDDGSTKLPFVGADLPGCEIGCTVRLVGQWERHPDYGLQFRATDVESKLPLSTDAIVRYMAANIKFCGPGTGTKLVAHFGPSTLALLAETPERAREVLKGKTADKVVASIVGWAEGYRTNTKVEQLKTRLMGAGITMKMARRIQQYFAKAGEAEDVVLRHPYRLVEVPGIGFKRADEMARGMGIALDDPSRIAAGVVYALEVAMELGHSALPRVALERRALDELAIAGQGIETETVRAAIARGLEAGTLIEDDGLIFLPRVIAQERELATRLAAFHAASRPLSAQERAIVEPIITESGLSATQATAVWMALEEGVAILTGRPGSGKTTTTRTFTRCCDALGWSVQLAAPTGKAASRAAEVTGLPAKTIHRMLGCPPGSLRDEPLEARVVILDESSMIDLDVAVWVVRNIDPKTTKLLFVGDRDQLPSVGHGSILNDMIASDRVPIVELREIFRQAAGSRIITNAHRLLDGHELVLDNEEGTDFLFADVTEPDRIGDDGFPIQDDPERSSREQEQARQRLVKALQFLIRKKGAIPARDIQVLTPMRKLALGVDQLNVLLQDTLNPDGEMGPMIGGNAHVRVGDRVIQTKNDYTVSGGLFNGEQGEVLEVDAERETVVVRFEDRVLTLKGFQLLRLRLAWAITVHRSQGSEFPYTILLYHTSHWVMLDRALLYTAITRARKMFILIGNYGAVKKTLQDGRRDNGRYTGLLRRIREASDAAADARLTTALGEPTATASQAA